ncbi:MAG: 50S ribosomal protein L3 [Victivallales bacterium]|nr:50S ribosomal protein L3 [Victivallales bacterium]
MKGLIGKKMGMTQIYDETGRISPVTVLEVGPCTVLDQRTEEKNGYSALQLGFGKKKSKNVTKAVKGHCEKSGRNENPPAYIKEIRLDKDSELETGSEIKADIFNVNEYVDVTGTIKGRGFQGVVKKYNFGGGRFSHGGGWKRKPGSIGQCEFPGRVDKGKKMPGHMGNVRRTIQNLKIVRVDANDNLIFIKGAVPGPTGGVIVIRSAKKKTAAK